MFSIDDDFQFSSDPPKINTVPGTSRGCLTMNILSSAVVEHDKEIHLTIAENTTTQAVVVGATTTVLIEDNGSTLLCTHHERMTVGDSRYSYGGIVMVATYSYPMAVYREYLRWLSLLYKARGR